ncbi:hypothetical protein HAX54_053267, partial [Datura stramonium]|nr:hypothetical protein [Datura stramonium]
MELCAASRHLRTASTTQEEVKETAPHLLMHLRVASSHMRNAGDNASEPRFLQRVKSSRRQ